MSENAQQPNPEPSKNRFKQTVEHKASRKRHARATKERSLWFWLGMMGLVGWSVSIPTLIGIFIGVQLDRVWGGRVSWTLTFLILGLAVGCLQAWYWVRRESRGE